MPPIDIEEVVGGARGGDWEVVDVEEVKEKKGFRRSDVLWCPGVLKCDAMRFFCLFA